jgi:serine/threonine protein kinase
MRGLEFASFRDFPILSVQALLDVHGKVPGKDTCPNQFSMPWQVFPVLAEHEPSALDLLARLLTYDPRRRITAQGAMRHPFFAECGRAEAAWTHAHELATASNADSDGMLASEQTVEGAVTTGAVKDEAHQVQNSLQGGKCQHKLFTLSIAGVIKLRYSAWDRFLALQSSLENSQPAMSVRSCTSSLSVRQCSTALLASADVLNSSKSSPGLSDEDKMHAVSRCLRCRQAELSLSVWHTIALLCIPTAARNSAVLRQTSSGFSEKHAETCSAPVAEQLSARCLMSTYASQTLSSVSGRKGMSAHVSCCAADKTVKVPSRARCAPCRQQRRPSR